MPLLTTSLRALGDLGRVLGRIAGVLPLRAADDPELANLVRRADEAARTGRREEARRLYRDALARQKHEPAALRGLRDLALEAGAWRDAAEMAERLVAAVPAADRAREAEWVAVAYYELGQVDAERGDHGAAAAHLKSALKADRSFTPAALALGDAYEKAGDHREAMRTWERAAEIQPALPLLVRLERAYREEGRPSRMIALYRSALERSPDDLGLAVALGRVYFELEMLDEAADQFEKVEVRASDMPAVHAYLGAIFERRGEAREAFEEYRRALRLAEAFEWPQQCTACGARGPTWRARCPQCRRWNTLRPAVR